MTVTRGQKVRTYTVRPWLFGSILSVFTVFSFGYLGATAYLLYRDDLLGSTLARQVELQYEYEDRIAMLRSEIDRVTSKHLVATQGVEEQVALVAERQHVIERRQQVLDSLIEKARESGIEIAGATAPLPVPRPITNAVATIVAKPGAAMAFRPASAAAVGPIEKNLLRATPDTKPSTSSHQSLRPILREIQSSLEKAETTQVAVLDVLNLASEAEVDRLSGLLKTIGLRTPNVEGTGGPFIAAGAGHFVDRVQAIDRTLDQLNKMRSKAASMPLGNPVEGAPVTSRFGYRLDPFLRRPALHSGIDFRAQHGTPVRATAPGRVVFAGWRGGYGRLIEIEHADGLRTRYGHLSAISVRSGAAVLAGDMIGKVGSSGRSTGPHLHYETRQRGEAVDPTTYLALGRSLADDP